MRRSVMETDIARFRSLLKQKRAALREDIRNELLRADSELYIEIAGRVHDLGEESVADLLADQNITVIDRHVSELRDVEEALRRMDQGTYGRCTDCGEPISQERLEVVPSTIRCTKCQARIEQAKTGNAYPKL